MVTVKLVGVFITNTLTETLQRLRPKLPYLVDILSNNGQRYASVLVTEDSGTKIAYTLGRSDKGLAPQTRIDPASSSLGIAMSVFDGKTTYTVTTNNLDFDYLATVARTFSGEVVAADRISEELKDTYRDDHWTTESEQDPTKTDTKRTIEILETLADQLLRTDSRIVSGVTYHDFTAKHRIFADPYKLLSQVLYSNTAGLVVTARDNDHQRVAFRIVQSPGYEVLEQLSENVARETGEDAIIHLGASKIQPSEYRIILGPRASGLVAHESFGHGFEADRIVVNSSRGADFIGQRVGSDLVTIRDHPGLLGRNGSYFFDDQGTIVQEPTTMVENGILQEQPLTDLDSFLKLKNKGWRIKRSPNGRAEAYNNPIYPRMSNTYFDTDNRGVSFEEMCERVDNGVYLDQGFSGMEDPLGWGIQLTFLRGWKIKDGIVTRECFYMPTGTGNVPDLLQSIDMIGNVLEIVGAGRCGKGHKEFVRVSSGGTYLSGKMVLG